MLCVREDDGHVRITYTIDGNVRAIGACPWSSRE